MTSVTTDNKPKKFGRPAMKDSDSNANMVSYAYNMFIKQRIEQLKSEQPETSAKELYNMAISEWKLLDKQEQQTYKSIQEN